MNHHRPAPVHRGAQSTSPHALRAVKCFLLLLVLTAGDGWAGSIRLLEPYGRLRDNKPVAIVGSNMRDMVVTEGLDDVVILRMDSDRRLNKDSRNLTVQHGGNWLYVSGIDRQTGLEVADGFAIFGSPMASLLVRPRLFDVELLPDDEVRLRLAIFREPTDNPTDLGRTIFSQVDVLVFHKMALEATFRIERVEYAGRSYDVGSEQWRNVVIGEGDCPFVLISAPTKLKRALAESIATGVAEGKTTQLLIVGGSAVMPGRTHLARFDETVAFGPLSPEELKALAPPQPCAWLVEPPRGRRPAEADNDTPAASDAAEPDPSGPQRDEAPPDPKS